MILPAQEHSAKENVKRVHGTVTTQELYRLYNLQITVPQAITHSG